MIRPTDSRPARRRLAVIEIPRTHAARLGSIGPAPDPPIAWSTISASTPDTSDNWMALKLYEQAHTRENIPGTLQYTPTPVTPQPAPAAAPARDYSLWVFGAIGALAGLAYLIGDNRRR